MFDQKAHESTMVQILKDVYANTALGPSLGFKGGTAAYLFYSLERFSVDLDFDLLNPEKENQVFEEVKKIIPAYGVLKESHKKRFNLVYILSYQEDARNIKIEINRRNFGSKYAVKNYLGIPMKVMVREDMFAHKLMALLERKKPANRDLFDVWFFLRKNWPLNKDVVEQRSGLKLEQYLKKSIEHVKNIAERDILQGMGELLAEGQKAWAKKNLKRDTLFLLRLLLTAEQGKK